MSLKSLVTKLCLVTHRRKLCFPSCPDKPWVQKEAELLQRRSQAELGNEWIKPSHSLLGSHDEAIMKHTFFGILVALLADVALLVGDDRNFQPNSEKADKDAYYRAQQQLPHETREEKRDQFLALVATGRENEWVDWSRLSLSLIFEQEGNEAAMLEQLQAVAALPGTRQDLNYGKKQTATVRLGHYYFHKGDYKKSREIFTQWQPSSGCGTCFDEPASERDLFRTVCRIQLGEQADVARELLDAVLSGKEQRLEIIALLFRLYDTNNQSDNLVDMLNRSETAQNNTSVRYLLWLHHLTESTNVDSLIQLCTTQSWGMIDGLQAWCSKRRFAADALTRCLGADVAPILDLPEDQLPLQHWLIYVLGKSRSPQGLARLVKETNRQMLHAYQNVIYAISLQGEAGNKVLKDLAKSAKEPARRMAQHRLTRMLSVDPLERPWPAFDRGALPR